MGKAYSSSRQPITIDRLLVVGLATAALATVSLGTVGYLNYLHPRSLPNALYYSLGLLVLSFERSPDLTQQVPFALNLARFMGVAVAFGAVFTASVALVSDRAIRFKSKRQTGHILLLGGTTLAVELAAAFSIDKRVVLIGEPDATGLAELRRLRIATIAAVSSKELESNADGAERVVVCMASDTDAIHAAASLLPNLQRPTRLVVMVDDPLLAHRMTHMGRPAAGVEVEIRCVAERVATEVLQEHPPTPSDALAPPAIVIGEGHSAEAMLRAIVVGCQLPGAPVPVICIGPHQAGWAESLAEELQPWGDVRRVHGPWSPALVAQQIQAALDKWGPILVPSDRLCGPLIVITGIEDALAYAIAGELVARPFDVQVERDAERLSMSLDSRIVAVVQESGDWMGLTGILRTTGGSLHSVAIQDLLTTPEVLDATQADLLARELEVYEDRWPDDLPPLMGPGGLGTYKQFAEAIEKAIPAAALHIRGGSRRLVLSPGEVAALTPALLRSFQVDAANDEIQHRVQDLVAALPLMLARIGRGLHRTAQPDVVLTDHLIERMAKQTHVLYQEHAATTDNATGSAWVDEEWDGMSEWVKESNRAQIRDIPIKLAMVNMDLAQKAGGTEPGWALDADDVRRLAIHEHRRWVYHHLLAGWRLGGKTDKSARVHSCLKPWDKLSPKEQSYDTDAVNNIPRILDKVGLRAVPRM